MSACGAGLPTCGGLVNHPPMLAKQASGAASFVAAAIAGCGQSQPSRNFFPQYFPWRTRGGSLPVAPAGTTIVRMTNHFLLARDGLPHKTTKRTQGLPSWCARGGKMTPAFLLVTGRRSTRAKNYETNPSRADC